MFSKSNRMVSSSLLFFACDFTTIFLINNEARSAFTATFFISDVAIVILVQGVPPGQATEPTVSTV